MAGVTASPFEDDVAAPGSAAAAATKPLSHPYTVLAHFTFRTGAVLAYLFCTLFSDSFAMAFIVIVLLLSLDFWTVKNITGRKLVSLRWWNKVAEDGSSEWIFESRKGPSPTENARERRMFWWSLYLYCIVWGFFALTSALKLAFSYLLIVTVALTLNIANVVGYTKCEKNARKQITQMASDYLGPNLMSQAVSGIGGLIANSQGSGTT